MKKGKLPEYLNCDVKGEIIYCQFYMHKACPETCSFALDIKQQGVGATDPETVRRLDELDNGGLQL